MSVLAATTGNGKTLWYLTRGTGAVALLLLTAGVVLGVMSSTRWRAGPVPRFIVSGLHRNVTLLAVAFVVVHVVTTVVDKFAPIGYQDAVVPFLSPYRPIWLGLGAVAFDLLIALIATSLLRQRIGLRSWRTVHWLAYVSWPIALVHTLGTGSDARTAWLGVLNVVCTLAVLFAVLWRAAAASGPGSRRAGFAAAAFAVPLGIFIWAATGPLLKGWAARAGTPRTLLASARRAAASAPAGRSSPPTGLGAVLPRAFRATIRGRLEQTSTGNGLVVVTIDGVASGSFRGRVHVALRGEPLLGGGVQMIDSSVGLLPRGAQAWAPGRVVGLDGQRIFADVRTAGGAHIRVELALRISRSGRVTGSMRGTKAGGPPE